MLDFLLNHEIMIACLGILVFGVIHGIDLTEKSLPNIIILRI